LEHAGEALRLRERPALAPAPGELHLAVLACAVCRTDLHLVDGELAGTTLPRVPGHEIVGRVLALGTGVSGWQVGDRAGVPWLAWTCGECEPCRRGDENLCTRAKFTGQHVDGGFATEVLADARFAVPLPTQYSDVQAAPLLCAGLIGWRALKAAGLAPRLGLYGFGAAAHLVAQLAHSRGQECYAFVRPGDAAAAAFARSLGAVWAAGSDERPPKALDAAIIFAPVGALIPQALRCVRPGGTVVCAGIHMSDIPAFPYGILWGERVLRSVANLTRRDAREFLDLAASLSLRVSTVGYPLADANQALSDLRAGRLSGAAVLQPALDA
jgi:propanol-preferring alcohol dehydrogenase